MCSKFLMKLKILNSNEFERIIIDDVKDVKIDVFLVDNNNRNWFIIFWKVWVAALNVDQFIIQFFNHVCYNSEKESIEKEREYVDRFLTNFNLKIIVTLADLKEFLIKC